ncbi:MAG: hypothetical protein CMH27_08300 [Micavibrio sp.]|nr:hypothetical protein [Micavibrio sp.]|tara:strand:+ start:3451 stop:4701 length:1251 start_codon:yes stop_codon:yes gene_type:complete
MGVVRYQNISQTKPDFIVKFGLFILFAYLTTSYFYIFRTGLPQISDFIMAFGMLFVFGYFFIIGRLGFTQVHVWALAFAAWTFVINIIHYVVYPDIQFFLSSLYYLYNVGIFIMISLLFREAPNATLKTIFVATAIALVVEIVICHFYPNYENGRVQGTFHNPNQLGFWALFSACIMILLRSYSKFRWYDLAIFFGFAFLQSLAISKAGLIAFGILAISLPFMRAMPNSYRIMFFMTALVIGIFSINHMADLSRLATQVENINNVVSRLDNIGREADDTLQWRGYYRILEYPAHAIVGAGEGAYERFEDTPQPVEIHSSIINVIFSYGLMGMAIFGTLMYMIVKFAPKHFMVILFVMMLNGLTHQNMRFSHFWIVFGVAYGMRYCSSQYKERKSSEMMPLIYADGRNTIPSTGKMS